MKVIVTSRNAPARPAAASGNEFNIRDDSAPPAGGSGAPAAEPAVPPDEYTARLLALIPTEVTALFVALIAAVKTAPDATVRYAPMVLLSACALLTVLQLRHLGRKSVPKVVPHTRQYVLSVLAFLAWGASIADPLEAFGWYVPKWILISAIMLIPAGGAALFDGP